MSFDLPTIAIFVALAGLFPLFPPSWRGWLLLSLSVFAVYWLQPPLPLRFADFVLPTVTLCLVITSWQFTVEDRSRKSWLLFRREDWQALLLIGLVVLLMALMRYLPLEWRLTPSRPPALSALLVGLLFASGGILLLRWLARGFPHRQVMSVAMVILVLLFVFMKTEPLTLLLARWWRLQTGQEVGLAATFDWRWLGFSYVAFRVLHTFRDHQLRQLPSLTLREYVTYALFFPAYTAGPIDRAERFCVDFRALPVMPAWGATRFGDGGWRILSGLFKKFVVADSLALGLSLTTENAMQAGSAGGLWLLLYGYALRLYFDFSGYTDIAIGLGILFGIQLPENFRRPYLRTSITAFWQSWHVTLSDWARFYIFTPLSRTLLRRKPRPSPVLIVFIAQLATMIVIGLWHGVSGGFLIWGIWHGLGLFVHKQWSDRTRAWYRRLQKTRWRWGWAAVTWFITFHFVLLGWVWFLFSSPSQALSILLRLFDFGGLG